MTRAIIIAALIIATAIIASMALATPAPSTGYSHLYFCAYEDGHVLYAENSRQLDCPGHPEVLRVVGNEVENP